jgi:hypothetical protein
MTNIQLLNFLQEKIQEIGSAICFNLSDSVLKLPTSVVNTLKVDDYGFVWFFMQKPKQHLNEFEKEFPVRMDFFKKGTAYFLQVLGKGWVVTDPEEMNSIDCLPENAKRLAMKEMVLVKVKILKAEYYEKAPGRLCWWQNLANTFNAWFGTNPYRPGTYFPAS